MGKRQQPEIVELILGPSDGQLVATARTCSEIIRATGRVDYVAVYVRVADESRFAFAGYLNTPGSEVKS